MLGDVDNGLKLLSTLMGNIHIIRGNHDTDEKVLRYNEWPNVKEIRDAKYIRCGKKTLYLSHFPGYGVT